MKYCREKLIDVMLESKWISLEERFDLDIAVKSCIIKGIFSKADWEDAEDFLCTGNGFNTATEKVILVLADKLFYTDDRFLQDKDELTAAYYHKLEKGVRL